MKLKRGLMLREDDRLAELRKLEHENQRIKQEAVAEKEKYDELLKNAKEEVERNQMGRRRRRKSNP